MGALIPFPRPPIRYWRLRELRQQPGTWQAFFYGSPANALHWTPKGSLHRVLAGLVNGGRQGLPIIVVTSEAMEAA
jgi:hypothetical protein